MWPTILRADWKTYLLAHGFDNTQAEAFLTAYDFREIDQDTLMFWAWRVREWTVSAGSFDFMGISVFGSAPHWTATGSWGEFKLKMKRVKSPPDELDPLRDVIDESDILGPYTDYPDDNVFSGSKTLRNAGIYGQIDYSAVIDEDTSVPGGADPQPANTGGRMLGGHVMWNPGSQKFHPLVSIFGFAASPGSDAANVEWSTTDDAGFNAAGHVTFVNPFGSNLVLPIGIRGGHLPHNNEGTGTVSDITVTPTLYWGYETSAGDLVWDETSGVQLRDPRS